MAFCHPLAAAAGAGAAAGADATGVATGAAPGSGKKDNDIFDAKPAVLERCPTGYETSPLERKRRAVEHASLLIRSDATLPLCPEAKQMGVPFTRVDIGYKLPFLLLFLRKIQVNWHTLVRILR